MKKRLQNRIAESRAALPWTVAYTVLVWVAAGAVTRMLWLQFALFGMASMALMLLNNVNALIRIYSRMVSCSFIVMGSMAAFLFQSVAAGVVELSLTVFYLCFFRAYQDQSSMELVFYAFAALGIGAMAFPGMLLFVPLFLILLATNVQALTLRTFFAALLGIMLPLWVVGALALATGQLTLPEPVAQVIGGNTATDLLAAQLHLPQPIGIWRMQPDAIDPHRVAVIAFVAVMAVIGAVHFLRNSYRDKIRVRMIYEALICTVLAIIVAIVLLPNWADGLLAMLLVTTAPLIGHFIALTHTRWTNLLFILITATAAAITFYNIWM